MKDIHEYSNNFTESFDKLPRDFINSSEYQKALRFLEKGCNCGCSAKLPHEKSAQLRVQFQDLPKPSQDAFVMANLILMDEGETTTSSRFPKRVRTNRRTFYRWNNKTPLCQETYFNMLGISLKYLENVKIHLFHKGLTPRIHGNVGKLPLRKTKMVIDWSSQETVKNFIEKYAEEHGLPNPGRSKRSTKATISLPTDMSYSSVHREFITSLEEGSNLKKLGYRPFCRIWQKLTPHIGFMTPRSDLCNTCQQFRNEMHSCQDKVTRQTQKKNFLNTEKEPN